MSESLEHNQATTKVIYPIITDMGLTIDISNFSGIDLNVEVVGGRVIVSRLKPEMAAQDSIRAYIKENLKLALDSSYEGTIDVSLTLEGETISRESICAPHYRGEDL